MITRSKEALGTIADAITLILAVPIIWQFVKPFILSSTIWVRAGAFVLTLILFATVFRTVRDKYKKLKTKLRDDKIQNDLNEIKSTKTKGQPLSKLLPQDDVLIRWVESLNEKAKEWADDAGDPNVNFYMYVKAQGITPSLQAFYYSPWKKMQLTQYHGDYEGERVAEKDAPYASASFLEVPKWREAVLKAYERVADQLPTDYRLLVQSSVKGKISIAFEFSQGNLDKNYTFAFDGATLTDSKDQSQMPIR